MSLHQIDFTVGEYTALYNRAYRGAGTNDVKLLGSNFVKAMDQVRKSRRMQRLSVLKDPCHREHRKVHRHGESVVIEIRK